MRDKMASHNRGHSFITYLKGTRKLSYALVFGWTFFMLLLYVMLVGLDLALKPKFVAIVFAAGLGCGLGVALVYAVAGFRFTERVRKLMTDASFREAGVDNIRLVDGYGGWMRHLHFFGSFGEKNVEIRYHSERESFVTYVILDIYVEVALRYYEKVGELRVNKVLTAETIARTLREAHFN
jgi:hypothetical protein